MSEAEPVGGAFENRLRKNARHFARWARARGLTAYRVYDRDIPEYPYALDWYDGRVHVSEYPRRRTIREGQLLAMREEVLDAAERVLSVGRDRLYVKTHLRMPWGRSQYRRVAHEEERFTVQEGGLRFWVNLGDYLDTGLFLDHRKTRAMVRDEARGTRFLNLFAYTGSFTVYAAHGGAASTTSVDLSGSYLAWAEENLALNHLWGPQHQRVQADAVQWLREAAARGERFELAVLDPPSFSCSKRMRGTLDVQRDHPALLAAVAQVLPPGGVLYFSTNYRRFALSERALLGWRARELTPGSLPEDFRQKDAHRCWRMERARL